MINNWEKIFIPSCVVNFKLFAYYTKIKKRWIEMQSFKSCYVTVCM